MYMKYNMDKNGPEPEPVPMHRARRSLADLINKVAYGKERILLGRRGRAVVAIIPVEDFRMLEAMEDRIDLEIARKALAADRGKRTIPLSEVKARLGHK